MTKADDPEIALRAWLAKKANLLVEFLDPHLPSRSLEHGAGNDRWPLRKLAVLIVLVSLFFWAVVFVVTRILLSF